MQEKNLECIPEMLDDLRRQADEMKIIVRVMGARVADKIYGSMRRFVQNEVPRRFNASIENGTFDSAVGSRGTIMLALISHNGAMLERTLQPVCDNVNDYLRMQLHEWQDALPEQINPDLTEILNRVDDLIAQFDLKLDRVTEILANGNENEICETGRLAHHMVTVWVSGAISLRTDSVCYKPFLVPSMIVDDVLSIIYSGSAWKRNLMSRIGAKAVWQCESEVCQAEASVKALTEDFFKGRSSLLHGTALHLIEETEKELNRILERNCSNNPAQNL